MQVSQVYLCRCPSCTYVGVLIIPMQVSQVYLYRCPRYILYHGRQVSAAISTSTTTTTTNINCSGEKFYSEQEFCDCDVIRISFNHLFQFKEAGLRVTFITPYPTVNLHYPPTQSDLYNLLIQKPLLYDTIFIFKLDAKAIRQNSHLIKCMPTKVYNTGCKCDFKLRLSTKTNAQSICCRFLLFAL